MKKDLINILIASVILAAGLYYLVTNPGFNVPELKTFFIELFNYI